MLITRKLSEPLERLKDGYQLQRHLQTVLNYYSQLRFDVCICLPEHSSSFFNNCLFFETTPKCRVDTSLLYFSREGRKRGERLDRGGRGNVPELSASVRQSQFIPKPRNNLSKFLAGRGRESSRQHSLICIQNKDVWTRHSAGKIVRRH